MFLGIEDVEMEIAPMHDVARPAGSSVPGWMSTCCAPFLSVSCLSI
jgi:hypothetical protein